MLKIDNPSETSDNSSINKSTQSLLQHVVNQLTYLQEEYHQIHLWLDQIHQQIDQREAQIRQCLVETTTLLTRIIPSNTNAFSSSHSAQVQLYVQTLGQFQVCYNGRNISIGSNKKGRAIFRYLINRPRRRIAKDKILLTFWPNDSREKANHKLHIAISVLRQALKAVFQNGEYILFDDNCYFIHPSINVCLDHEEFVAHLRTGEQLQRANHLAEALIEYNAAYDLYQGDFLPQDLYVDWTLALRTRLEEMYLTLLGYLMVYHFDQEHLSESVSYCRQILAKDNLREDAYRQIMLCYASLGQRSQALREFCICEQALKQELNVRPSQKTIALYDKILAEQPLYPYV